MLFGYRHVALNGATKRAFRIQSFWVTLCFKWSFKKGFSDTQSCFSDTSISVTFSLILLYFTQCNEIAGVRAILGALLGICRLSRLTNVIVQQSAD